MQSLNVWYIFIYGSVRGTFAYPSGVEMWDSAAGGGGGWVGFGSGYRSAIVALHQTHFVAVHAFESDEFRCEVIAMHRFLRSFARRTRQQTVTAAGLAGECGCCGLNTPSEKRKK